MFHQNEQAAILEHYAQLSQYIHCWQSQHQVRFSDHSALWEIIWWLVFACKGVHHTDAMYSSHCWHLMHLQYVSEFTWMLLEALPVYRLENINVWMSVCPMCISVTNACVCMCVRTYLLPLVSNLSMMSGLRHARRNCGSMQGERERQSEAWGKERVNTNREKQMMKERKTERKSQSPPVEEASSSSPDYQIF